MRKLVFLFPLLLFYNAVAQDPGNSKGRYVIVPSESVVLVTASQTESPIEIGDLKLLNSVDGNRRSAFQYELRNRGAKPIKYVSVWSVTSAATGGGPLYNGHSLTKPLMPGEKVAVGESSLGVVKLTALLRESLKLTGPVRAVVVLLIESVEYTDGSVFTDRNTVKALEDYFININSEEINLMANPVSMSLLTSPSLGKHSKIKK